MLVSSTLRSDLPISDYQNIMKKKGNWLKQYPPQKNKQTKKKLCKCLTATTSVEWQHAAYTIEQLTISLMLKKTNKLIQKAFLFAKNIEFSFTIVKRNRPLAEKGQDRKRKKAGQKTRQKTVRWNQMTAPGFQTLGKQQRSPASLRIRTHKFQFSDNTVATLRYGQGHRKWYEQVKLNE